MGEITLAERLIKCREDRGLSQVQAAERMPHVGRSHLRALEGSNAQRPPGEPSHLRLLTVLDLIEAYWPDLTLDHFMQSDLRVIATNFQARRRLQRNAPDASA